MKKSSLLIAALVVISACSKQEPAAEAPAAQTAAPAQDSLAASVNSETRSPEDKARDQYRHPQEALAFWGLQPGMTILEVQPGGGWWTEILAPYARATGGKYYATGADLDNPELSSRWISQIVSTPLRVPRFLLACERPSSPTPFVFL